MEQVISGANKAPEVIDIRLDWLEEDKGIVTSSHAKEPITVSLSSAPPPECRAWSAHHLLLCSISASLVGAFLLEAAGAGLELSRIECETKALVHSGPENGKLSNICLRPRVYVTTDEQAEQAWHIFSKIEQELPTRIPGLGPCFSCKGSVEQDEHPRQAHQFHDAHCAGIGHPA